MTRSSRRVMASLLFLFLLITNNQACSPTFAPGGEFSGDFSSISDAQTSGKTLYQTNCASCHGSLQSSLKLGKSSSDISAAMSSVPQMRFLSLSSAEIGQIASVLNGANTSAEPPFTCTDKTKITPVPLFRLTAAQYANTLKSLYGASVANEFTAELRTLPSDVTPEVGGFQHQYSQVHIDTFHKIAKGIGSRVELGASFVSTLGGSCLTASAPTQACVDTFIENFGLKAYRRPLTAVEKTQAKTLYTTVGQNQTGVAAIFQLFMMSPYFLYRLESGESESNGVLKLTSYEVAARLSYMLWDTMPDDALFTAAKNGELKTEAGLSKQVDRMLAHASAKEKMKGFVQFWLHLDQTPDLDGISAPLKADINTTGLWNEMLRESGEAFNHVLFTQNGSFADLMTTDVSFAKTQALASIHGHSSLATSAPQTMGPGRKGILMRGPFLASADGQSRPILRGVHLRRYVMCQPIPSPTGDVTSEGPDVSTEEMIRLHSTRDRTSMKTSETNCMSCHSAINPAGFAFEGFDGLGRARITEKQFSKNGQLLAIHPINSATTMPIGSEVVSASNATEFVGKLANRDEGAACMMRTFYRFYRFQNETSQDECVLKDMMEQSDGTRESLLRAIKKLFVDQSLTHKTLSK